MMLESGDSQPLPSAVLRERYGAGYFHGRNSGFSEEGYDRVHATWRHWMDFVRAEVGPAASWLDLGCAYGFLVAEARQAGFRAIGLDASAYAVRQAGPHAPEAVGHVVSGHAERLPFADRSLDVLSAFDLLEHVPDPSAVVAEAARVLRPGGLFLAATPDPLAFDRAEPTHVAEHVPSFWLRELEQAGFGTALRFFQAPYNCELVARRAAAPPAISFDGLASDPALETAGDPALRVALRSGFGAPAEDGGRIVSDGAIVYLLNDGRAPLELAIDLELGDSGALTLALAGRIVARFAARASGASDTPSVRRAQILLPAGGHGLRIALERGWARLRRLRVAAAPGDREALCASLPFDLYERYALAAAVLSRIAPHATRLLDVGGTMGGDAGHLAWTGDFFPELAVTVADRRPVDHPAHVALGGDLGLPFADRSFEVVTALDVLEHVPAAERSAWLDGVWRVAGHLLLLGNPFATPGVADADRYLFELIRSRYGYEHRFLAEHLAHGHPEIDATRAFFAERGASVSVLPSGYLPAWMLLQTMNAWLSHPQQDWTFAAANRAVNRAVGLASSAEPAYRHLLVIDRSGRDHAAELATLVASRSPDLEALAAAIAALATAQGDGVSQAVPG